MEVDHEDLGDEDDGDEDDDRYRRTKDTWWDLEENDEDPENPEDNEPDPHNWCLPESDKTVKEFLCENCGEHFKVGYMDGRKRHAFCPLCGGKGSRVKEQG